MATLGELTLLHVAGVSYAPFGGWQVALRNAGGEPGAAEYARQPVTFTAPSGGGMSSIGPISFPVAVTAWNAPGQPLQLALYLGGHLVAQGVQQFDVQPGYQVAAVTVGVTMSGLLDGNNERYLAHLAGHTQWRPVTEMALFSTGGGSECPYPAYLPVAMLGKWSSLHNYQAALALRNILELDFQTPIEELGGATTPVLMDRQVGFARSRLVMFPTSAFHGKFVDHARLAPYELMLWT